MSDKQCLACKGPADIVTAFTAHAVSAKGEQTIERMGKPDYEMALCIGCANQMGDFFAFIEKDEPSI